MIGQSISGFNIIEKLGEGGMGVVYKAEDTRLRRTVALKFMHPGLMAEADARARFLREAQVAASLDHQNICTVYSIEETDDYTFIVMAYIEGHDLRKRLEQSPLPMEEALDLFAQISTGLQAAHNKGIIHRDIKPANIMISTEGRVKITDFGLAKFLGGTGITDAETTHGTPSYMAPERWRGEEPDQRSDIFSLGAVAYEMITGEHPFPGMYKDAIFYSIMHTTPARLDTRLDTVPDSLQEVVDRTLEKNLEERYSDVGTVVADVEALIQGKPISSQLGMPEPEPVLEPHRPFPWKYTALVAVPILVAATAVWWLFPGKQDGPIKIAVLPFTDASPDSSSVKIVDGFTEDLMIGFSPVRGMRISSRDAAFAYKNKDIEPREIARELGVGYLLSGSIVQDGGLLQVTAWLTNVETGFQVWIERWNTPRDGLLSTRSAIVYNTINELDITLTQGETEQLDRPATTNPEAYALYIQGLDFFRKRTRADNEVSTGFFTQAIRMDSTFADAYARLANVYTQRLSMRWVETMDEVNTLRTDISSLTERALELDDGSSTAHLMMAGLVLGTDPDRARTELLRVISINPNSAEAYRALAFLYLNDRQYTEALEAVENQIDLESNQSTGYSVRGDIYTVLNRHDNAVQAYQRAVEIDLGRPYSLKKLADSYREVNRFVEAEEVYQEIITINPAAFTGYKSMGDLYTWRGEYDTAAQWYRQALDRAPAQFDPLIYVDLGDLFLYTNQADSALYYYAQTPSNLRPNWTIASHRGIGDMDMVIQQARQTMTTNPLMTSTRYALGLAYERQGNRNQALAWYDSSAVHLIPWINSNRSTYDSFCLQALSLAKLGRHQEAMDTIEQALRIMPNPSGFDRYRTALVYAITGNIDHARDHLEQALQSRTFMIDWVQSDWEMEQFRQNPVIQEALERYERK